MEDYPKHVTITVSLSTNYGETVHTRKVDIEAGGKISAFTPLDFPARGTGLYVEKLYCAPVEIREIVKRNRNILAKQIAEEILNALKENDTVMGYKLEERDLDL